MQVLNQTDGWRYFTFPREFLKGIVTENKKCRIHGDIEWEGMINVMNDGDRIVLSTGWSGFLQRTGLKSGSSVKVTYWTGNLKFEWDAARIKPEAEVCGRMAWMLMLLSCYSSLITH